MTSLAEEKREPINLGGAPVSIAALMQIASELETYGSVEVVNAAKAPLPGMVAMRLQLLAEGWTPPPRYRA
jgi:hypothetical protein